MNLRTVVGTLCIACSSGVAGAQTCGLIRLDFGFSLPFHVAIDNNDAGVILGTRSGETDDDPAEALLWQAGVVTELPGLGAHTLARAINNSGQVVGVAEDANLVDQAVMWTNGVLTKLPLLSAPVPGSRRATGGAEAINDRGRAAGWSQAADGTQHAVLWIDGKIRDLNRIIGSGSSVAYAMNNHGQIVGTALFADGTYRAFLYQAGSVQFLGSLGGGETIPYDINDNGQTVGVSRTKFGKRRAFLWQNGVMKGLGTLGGENSAAHGINIYGQIVGASQIANGQTFAFSWKNGVMTLIGTLAEIEFDEKSFRSAAWKVNAKGQVVGTSDWFIRDTYTVIRPWRWKRAC